MRSGINSTGVRPPGSNAVRQYGLNIKVNTMKKSILTGLAVIMFSGASVAAEVGPVTTFVADTPALASDINANFQSLISAINNNYARIATLEAAVLNGGGGDPVEPPDLMNLITGSTYSIRYLFTQLDMTTNTLTQEQRGATNIASGSMTVTFNEGGGASIIENGEGFGMIEVPPIEYCPPVEGAPCVSKFDNRYEFEQVGGGGNSGAWSLSGSVLTLSFSDIQLVFDVTPDANVLVNSIGRLGAESISGASVETVEASMAIGVRKN